MTYSFSTIDSAISIDGVRCSGAIFNGDTYIGGTFTLEIHLRSKQLELRTGDDLWIGDWDLMLVNGEPLKSTVAEIEEQFLPFTTEGEGSVSWDDVQGNVYSNTDLTNYFIVANKAQDSGVDLADIKNTYKEVILLNKNTLNSDPTFHKGQATIRAYGAFFTDLGDPNPSTIGISAYGPNYQDTDYLPQIDLLGKDTSNIIIRPPFIRLTDKDGNTTTLDPSSGKTVHDETLVGTGEKINPLGVLPKAVTSMQGDIRTLTDLCYPSFENIYGAEATGYLVNKINITEFLNTTCDSSGGGYDFDPDGTSPDQAFMSIVLKATYKSGLGLIFVYLSNNDPVLVADHTKHFSVYLNYRDATSVVTNKFAFDIAECATHSYWSCGSNATYTHTVPNIGDITLTFNGSDYFLGEDAYVTIDWPQIDEIDVPQFGYSLLHGSGTPSSTWLAQYNIVRKSLMDSTVTLMDRHIDSLSSLFVEKEKKAIDLTWISSIVREKANGPTITIKNEIFGDENIDRRTDKIDFFANSDELITATTKGYNSTAVNVFHVDNDGTVAAPALPAYANRADDAVIVKKDLEDFVSHTTDMLGKGSLTDPLSINPNIWTVKQVKEGTGTAVTNLGNGQWEIAVVTSNGPLLLSKTTSAMQPGDYDTFSWSSTEAKVNTPFMGVYFDTNGDTTVPGPTLSVIAGIDLATGKTDGTTLTVGVWNATNMTLPAGKVFVALGDPNMNSDNFLHYVFTDTTLTGSGVPPNPQKGIQGDPLKVASPFDPNLYYTKTDLNTTFDTYKVKDITTTQNGGINLVYNSTLKQYQITAVGQMTDVKHDETLVGTGADNTHKLGVNTTLFKVRDLKQGEGIALEAGTTTGSITVRADRKVVDVINFFTTPSLPPAGNYDFGTKAALCNAIIDTKDVYSHGDNYYPRGNNEFEAGNLTCALVNPYWKQPQYNINSNRNWAVKYPETGSVFIKNIASPIRSSWVDQSKELIQNVIYARFWANSWTAKDLNDNVVHTYDTDYKNNVDGIKLKLVAIANTRQKDSLGYWIYQKVDEMLMIRYWVTTDNKIDGAVVCEGTDTLLKSVFGTNTNTRWFVEFEKPSDPLFGALIGNNLQSMGDVTIEWFITRYDDDFVNGVYSKYVGMTANASSGIRQDTPLEMSDGTWRLFPDTSYMSNDYRCYAFWHQKEPVHFESRKFYYVGRDPNGDPTWVEYKYKKALSTNPTEREIVINEGQTVVGLLVGSSTLVHLTCDGYYPSDNTPIWQVDSTTVAGAIKLAAGPGCTVTHDYSDGTYTISGIADTSYDGPYVSTTDIPLPYNKNYFYLVGTKEPYDIYAWIESESDIKKIGDSSIDLALYKVKELEAGFGIELQQDGVATKKFKVINKSNVLAIDEGIGIRAINSAGTVTISKTGSITTYDGPYASTSDVTSPATDVFYLIGTTVPYDIYAYIGGTYVQVGTTATDLANYFTKTEIQSDYYDKSSVDSIVAQYATITEVETALLDWKVQDLEAGSNITLTPDPDGSGETGKIRIDVSGGGSIMTEVHHDSTLTGTGTDNQHLLSVTNPFDSTNYYTISAINSLFYNKVYIDAGYYTKTEIDIALTGYYFKSEIDNKLFDYYNKSSIDTKFNSYYTKSAVDTKFGDYYNKTTIDSKFGAVDTKFNDYYTQSAIDTKFGDYYTGSVIDTMFGDYYNKSVLDSKFGDYYTKVECGVRYFTKTEIGNLYYTKSSVDAKFTDYYNKSAIDTKFNDYYNKTTLDTRFGTYYTKTEVDTELAAYTVKTITGSGDISVVTTNGNAVVTFTGNTSAYDGPYNTLNDIPTPYHTDYLYLIGTAAPYAIYAYIGNSWVQVGTTASDLNNYYTKTQSDARYYTQTQIDTGYYNKSDIDVKFGTYYTKNEVDGLLGNYYNKTTLDTKFDTYYTKTEIDTALGDYYNKSSIDTKFGDYYNKSTLDTRFGTYYTSTQSDTRYYTKTQIDGSFYTKTALDTKFDTYYNKSAIDTKFGDYYNKTTLDTKFGTYYTKTEIDTNYKVQELVAGSNVTLTPDSQNAKKLTIDVDQVGYVKWPDDFSEESFTKNDKNQIDLGWSEQRAKFAQHMHVVEICSTTGETVKDSDGISSDSKWIYFSGSDRRVMVRIPTSVIPRGSRIFSMTVHNNVAIVYTGLVSVFSAMIMEGHNWSDDDPKTDNVLQIQIEREIRVGNPPLYQDDYVRLTIVFDPNPDTNIYVKYKAYHIYMNGDTNKSRIATLDMPAIDLTTDSFFMGFTVFRATTNKTYAENFYPLLSTTSGFDFLDINTVGVPASNRIKVTPKVHFVRQYDQSLDGNKSNTYTVLMWYTKIPGATGICCGVYNAASYMNKTVAIPDVNYSGFKAGALPLGCFSFMTTANIVGIQENYLGCNITIGPNTPWTSTYRREMPGSFQTIDHNNQITTYSGWNASPNENVIVGLIYFVRYSSIINKILDHSDDYAVKKIVAGDNVAIQQMGQTSEEGVPSKIWKISAIPGGGHFEYSTIIVWGLAFTLIKSMQTVQVLGRNMNPEGDIAGASELDASLMWDAGFEPAHDFWINLDMMGAINVNTSPIYNSDSGRKSMTTFMIPSSKRVGERRQCLRYWDSDSTGGGWCDPIIQSDGPGYQLMSEKWGTTFKAFVVDVGNTVGVSSAQLYYSAAKKMWYSIGRIIRHTTAEKWKGQATYFSKITQ